MKLYAYEECCPECGHLLSNNRAMCPFCNYSFLNNQTNNTIDERYEIEDLTSGSYLSYISTQNELINSEVVL